MKYYLATTALSQIWDYEAILLLLSPSCLTGINKDYFKKDYVIIPSPLKPAIKIKEAADHCYQIYLDLLPEIYRELNRLHNVSYPLRYWQVLLGPWLLLFIKIFYDRYKRIENALDLYPDLFTHVVSPQCCKFVSVDTYDFTRRLNDDHYNLFLFSMIVRALLNPHNVIETSFAADPKVSRNQYRYNWKTRIFNKFTKRFFSKGKIILVDMYHLRNMDKLLLKLRTGYNKIGFMDFFENNTFTRSSPPDERLRRSIELRGSGEAFRLLLCEHIPMNIPVCYVEDFQKYSEYVNSIKNIEHITVLGSTVGWWFNDIFKFLAARLVLNNARLIEFQHGGGYRMYLAMLSEKVALEKDVFYVWGTNSVGNRKERYLPNPHLSRLYDTHTQKYNHILFIGTSAFKYLYRVSTFLQPEDMPKYFEDKKLFLGSLREDVKGRVLYRPYLDFGWDEINVLKKIDPMIKFLPLHHNLVACMKTVRLVVIDHPSTSLLEALVINVPSVFYWDHNVYLMRNEAEEYFELLRKVGILYKDPLSAARKVNKIFDNPLDWWLKEDIQSARNEFCKKYAYAQKDWMRIWTEELRCLDKAEKNSY